MYAYSGQNLTPSKMATRVSHLPTLRDTSELPSEVYVIPTFSRSPLWGSLRFEDFDSEPSSSSKRLLMLSVDSYAALFPFTFITCNTIQHEELWTVIDFFTCNPNKLAPEITTVITNQYVQIVWLWESRSYLYASMPTAQSSINRPLSQTKRGILILIPSRYTL